MALDKLTFDHLVALLLPLMGDPNSRKALVDSALIGCPVLNQIDWSGAARTFTVNLVHTSSITMANGHRVDQHSRRCLKRYVARWV